MVLTLKNKIKKIDRSPEQEGQASIEAVLITVLLLSLTVYGSGYMRSQNFIGKMVSVPWKQISGMMSAGHWVDPQTALDQKLHPHINTISREGD